MRSRESGIGDCARRFSPRAGRTQPANRAIRRKRETRGQQKCGVGDYNRNMPQVVALRCGDSASMPYRAVTFCVDGPNRRNNCIRCARCNCRALFPHRQRGMRIIHPY